ncbi:MULTISPECIES: threonine ammonia-lyase [Achromobacter]|uniref:Threonine ammonia-lyase n=1 Tax=Alcaligenes xylosoxydans xylosoxydans TaxID=85698 RepID=A0A0D6GG44_ALCXX|nr:MULTISPECIES: threonine ammonia-lyase [Achromobacter]AHC45756.1 Threonine dehydratase [Achromobacter xylosoxidans NBRC 15126 = ATCC 27061]AMH06196.1 threonine ammonia-lyase [Achromobacter xylosoxidans]AXA76050.1 threonine ammonia-lyase [Achromobacter xylosoxidans]EFV82701.1 threonine dehydratase catabolic [Achromobacter xylosoxidans C54]KMJ89982.1 threonine dehydratase [Achromobacter xylosoxidans]
MIDIASIQTARENLRGQVLKTPFTLSRTLSDIFGAEIWLKFENLQFTASFKERGALNRMLTLSEDERRAGVIAVSAGNHAQGVAYHAQRMGVPAVIVMPRFTPTVKVANTRRFGAEVVLAGDTFDDAKAHGYELAKQRGLIMIHPYDDEAVIAGQGTVALEMLEDQPQLDMLVIAIGGGGLISGIATAAKALKPGIEIIGVQTERFPAMYAAVKGVSMPQGQYTIAEGIAVKSPGGLTQPIVSRLVDDIELVSEADIEHAIVVLLEIEKTVVEGAGAAGLAALLRAQEAGSERFKGKRIGLVLTGGNIDPLMLGELIERGMVRAGRLARIRVDLRDLPGALAHATKLIADAQANITEVHHQRAFTSLPVRNVEVDFVLQTRGPEHIQEVIDILNAAGFAASNHDH